MKYIKDNRGNQWEIDVSVAAALRIRSISGIKIDKYPDVFIDLEDLEKRVNCLYAVLKPQLDAKNINDENFAQLLTPDILDEATEILVDEILNFFPKATRDLMKLTMEKTKENTKKELEKMKEEIMKETGTMMS